MRNFIKQAEEMGELVTLKGAHWNEEIGILRFIVKKGDLDCPTILFEDIADYPTGYRVLCGAPNSCRRLAMILGIEHDSNDPSKYLELIRKIKEKLSDLRGIPPKIVKNGPVMNPVMNNVRKGENVNLFEFPTPKWHRGDGGRYIGTMDPIISRDPEEGWINIGTYRTMIRDKASLLTYVDPGKQALAVGSQIHTGAFLGRYVIVVDEDVDPTNDYEVIWALSTRSDPENTIDILRRTWSGPLDPQIPAGSKEFCYNSRALLDACIPFERKSEYAPTVRFDHGMVKKLRAKYRQ